MSHIATVQCKIANLVALGVAVANKGGVFEAERKSFTSYNGTAQCSGAIRLNDASRGDHEIGLAKSQDGTFNFMWDNYGSGRKLEQAFGSGLMGLQNEYLAVVAETQLREQGYMVERVVEGQQLQVVATR